MIEGASLPSRENRRLVSGRAGDDGTTRVSLPGGIDVSTRVLRVDGKETQMMRKFIGTSTVGPSRPWWVVFLLAWSLTMQLAVFGQGESKNRSRVGGNEITGANEADAADTASRAFGVSLVISLATEARNYSDMADRARVLARAAYVLWDADNASARVLFARAWEAAERGDLDGVTVKTKDKPPDMVIALRKLSGQDLRGDVLTLASRRD